MRRRLALVTGLVALVVSCDRVFRGDMVVDFMNVGIGRSRTGVFNVADLSIVVGVVVFLVGSLLNRDSSDAPPERESPADQEPIP